ncbi:MAG: hypothetical protein KC912_17200 [Proteobacteria bacterium]|nr:hypothetical protein [Pseudomonadota bacterium]
MSRVLIGCLLLWSSSALAVDQRWMQVADGAESAEVRELALALAIGGADPSVERAAAKLILSLRSDLDPELPTGLVEADEVTAELRVARARKSWRSGDPERAISLLEPVRKDPLAAVLYAEVVDAWVASERERLGGRYFEGRSGPRSERTAVLREVQAGLSDLLDRYPGSIYAEPLADNLERVERELDLLW